MAVYGVIKTLVTVVKARVRIFTAGCERAFDKAVAAFQNTEESIVDTEEGGTAGIQGGELYTFMRNELGIQERGCLDIKAAGVASLQDLMSISDKELEEAGVKEGPRAKVFKYKMQHRKDNFRRQASSFGLDSGTTSSKRGEIQRQLKALKVNAHKNGLSDRLVHEDAGFTMYYTDAAVLRDEIQQVCAEWDVLLSGLIMVCLALIVLPIVHFTTPNSAGLTSSVGNDDADAGDDDDDDDSMFLHGSDIHYYLRDLFNIVVGFSAIYLALSETASLTNECEHCAEVIFELHKSTPWVPPLKGHCALRDYVCSPQYTSKFGFTIMGMKIENQHLATFGYVMVCIISAIGGGAASKLS